MKVILLSILWLWVYTNTFAQVPVSKEPLHPIVFENDKVRILNALLPPGDTTQYHIHSTPSVFIFFTKTQTGSQLINQQPVAGTSVAGTVLFENLDTPNTRIHRMWNVDTSAFHVMDIELIADDKAGFDNKPLSMSHAALQLDTPGVRTYIIKLNRNNRIWINKSLSDMILVALNSGRIQIKQDGKNKIAYVEEGSFYWIAQNENFFIRNLSASSSSFVLLEIK